MERVLFVVRGCGDVRINGLSDIRPHVPRIFTIMPSETIHTLSKLSETSRRASVEPSWQG